MGKNKQEFFELILKSRELLKQNYVSIDLLPDWPKDKNNVTGDSVKDLMNLLKTDAFTYTRSGYKVEIRENRYITILVDEWTKIKNDIKSYERDKKLSDIVNEK